MHLVVWTEGPGRPFVVWPERLANLLGHGEAGAAEGLDRWLADGGLALTRSMGSDEPATCHVGPLEFSNASGESHWFDTTVRVVEGHRMATLVDVTDSRRTAFELERKSERLELVLEGTRLGMWDWNPETGAVRFNDRWAEMLGHDLSEIRFELDEWQSRVHPDDLEACYRDIQAHVEGEVAFYENVHRMRHKDGHWVYILDRGKVVERNAEGAPVRFTGTHTDITLQKQAELDALAATHAKSLFLATMSHEIRTPLHGILGLLQVLDQTPLDEDQRELLALVDSSGKHLLHLINDILDLSKVEAGEVELVPAPFDLGSMVSSIVSLYGAAAREQGVELRSDAPEGTWIEADEHRLRQVLTNLVSNAVKFTAQGEIRVIARVVSNTGGARLVLEVRDTGSGIADTSRIFESFAQENATIDRSHGGTGLGLAICRRLVELMDGSLSVDSEVGAGSTFTLDLPVSAVDAPPLPSPSSSTGTGSFDGLRVLVAEDNPVNQRVVHGMFRSLGLEVTVVDDGAAAAECCAQESFDVVLMDLHMPRVDGLEATRRIVGDLGRKAPPIYALTADVTSESAAACREVGMVGTLQKPFRMEELTGLLADVAAPSLDAPSEPSAGSAP